MAKFRTLKIPAKKAIILGLDKDGRLTVSYEQNDQVIFVPDDNWLDWVLTIHRNESDQAFFVCCADNPRHFVFTGLWPSHYAMLADPQFVSQQVEQLSYRTISLLIIDGELAATWLIDNPL